MEIVDCPAVVLVTTSSHFPIGLVYFDGNKNLRVPKWITSDNTRTTYLRFGQVFLPHENMYMHMILHAALDPESFRTYQAFERFLAGVHSVVHLKI